MSIQFAVVFSVIISYAAAPPAARAADDLHILPSEFTLSTPESRQSLIVQDSDRGEAGRSGRLASNGLRAITWSPPSPTDW